MKIRPMALSDTGEEHRTGGAKPGRQSQLLYQLWDSGEIPQIPHEIEVVIPVGHTGVCKDQM